MLTAVCCEAKNISEEERYFILFFCRAIIYIISIRYTVTLLNEAAGTSENS